MIFIVRNIYYAKFCTLYYIYIYIYIYFFFFYKILYNLYWGFVKNSLLRVSILQVMSTPKNWPANIST